MCGFRLPETCSYSCGPGRHAVSGRSVLPRHGGGRRLRKRAMFRSWAGPIPLPVNRAMFHRVRVVLRSRQSVRRCRATVRRHPDADLAESASARATSPAGLSTPCPWCRSPSIQEARWARGGQPHAVIGKGDVLQAGPALWDDSHGGVGGTGASGQAARDCITVPMFRRTHRGARIRQINGDAPPVAAAPQVPG